MCGNTLVWTTSLFSLQGGGWWYPPGRTSDVCALTTRRLRRRHFSRRCRHSRAPTSVAAMRLLLHALGAAPRFQPLAAVAVASSEGWWEVEAQAFMREGRDWDAVCSAMRASVTNEDTPLPGDARQPPLPGPLPPWTLPPERAPARDKTRRETWALCVALLC
jgi:hypothetical protein